MQATKAGKPVSKRRSLWQRFTKRTPFWQQRLDERTDGELEPPDFLTHMGRWLNDIGSTIYALAVGAVAISALATFLIGPIFLSPDFMTVGLADPIGRGLAMVCTVTGRCDIQYLLAGTAVGVTILLLLVYIINYSLQTDDDEDTVNDAELAAGLSAIDERIVRLRADLVLAGVLPVSDEEKAEAEDAA